MTDPKPSLIGLDFPAIERVVTELGEPKFRAQQLHSWIYAKAERDFDQMTNIAKSLRTKLKDTYTLGCLEIVEKQVSEDGTTKYLFGLPDGQQVESVLMYFEEREVHAVCLSTQVGCAVNCDFCATGKMGFKRQLSVAEIVDQLMYVRSDSKATVRNVVFMGQGEPMLNYENTMAAIRIINQSAEIGMRHMTVSTSGIVPAIERLTNDRLQLTLAVSLHAPDNETREKFMPINRKYPLEVLIPALHRYVDRTGRRVTIEYILLAGINDSQAHAERLIALLRNLHCNINLIPYNPIGEEYGYVRPSREQVLAFRDWVMQGPHKVTVRIERGVDIAAACGQLQNRYGVTIKETACATAS
jgi:23S rRNA (adenine2503-C2)-methyltransferase